MRRRHASAATATNTPQDAAIPPDREAGTTPPRELVTTLRVPVTIRQPTHVHFLRPVIEERRADESVDVAGVVRNALVAVGA